MSAGGLRHLLLSIACSGLLGAPVLAGDEADQIAEQEVRAFLQDVAKLRGGEPPASPVVRVLDHEGMEALLADLQEQEPARSRGERFVAALSAHGFLGPLYDPEDELTRKWLGVPDGLYDPSDGALYYLRPYEESVAQLRAFTQRRDEVIVHELVHHLQHLKHPTLLGSEAAWRDEIDTSLAVRAMMEGEARHQAQRVVGMPPRSAAELESDGLQLGQLVDADYDGPPTVIFQLRSFPYVIGEREALRQPVGLLDRLPGSTEQLLHDRRHEPFTSIDLRAAHESAPPGCVIQEENTLGEFLISVLLRDLEREEVDEYWEHFDPDRPLGPPLDLEHMARRARAWEGWDGDRFLVGECGGSPELYWLSVWDTATDAREFERAYRAVAHHVNDRAERKSALHVTRVGAWVEVVSEGWLELAGAASSALRVARTTTLPEVLAFRGPSGPEPAPTVASGPPEASEAP